MIKIKKVSKSRLNERNNSELVLPRENKSRFESELSQIQRKLDPIEMDIDRVRDQLKNRKKLKATTDYKDYFRQATLSYKNGGIILDYDDNHGGRGPYFPSLSDHQVETAIKKANEYATISPIEVAEDRMYRALKANKGKELSKEEFMAMCNIKDRKLFDDALDYVGAQDPMWFRKDRSKGVYFFDPFI